MTDTFDWAGLAGSVVLANAGQGPDAAIAILQREIEAAFVPVEDMDLAAERFVVMRDRAEAAEARMAELTAQLAEARESERAAVVAWLRADVPVNGDNADRHGFAIAMRHACATAIDAGEHLT